MLTQNTLRNCQSSEELYSVSSVHSLSCVQLFATPVHWQQASLSFTIIQSLLKLMSTELMMPSNHLILCRPLLLPNLSQHQGLFWFSSLHQVAKVSGTSASASVLPMNIQVWLPLGLTGLISLQSEEVYLAPKTTVPCFLTPPCRVANVLLLFSC